ncbi:hypothetical protein IMSHALPRED_011128 [Imshaugia aleurites]|uniref:Uncharacterized protein n=1 Tax=Imshaugia aleurites TaxID=172621 RepID=A0A8H3G615_9LECA|nr:hypothetical protein IMSHALPRED_011128 [Imshaugia aleurites]
MSVNVILTAVYLELACTVTNIARSSPDIYLQDRHVIVPALILLCSFLNTHFSLGTSGSADANMGIGRLWIWMLSLARREEANHQQVLDDKKVRDVFDTAYSGGLNFYRNAWKPAQAKRVE